MVALRVAECGARLPFRTVTQPTARKFTSMKYILYAITVCLQTVSFGILLGLSENEVAAKRLTDQRDAEPTNVDGRGRPRHLLTDVPNVIELTDEIFDEETSNKHLALLVHAYMPGCRYCQKLSPEIEEAATLLAEAGYYRVLAQLDAHANRRSRAILGLADGLEEYPQFKIFVNGVLSEQEVTLPADAGQIAVFLTHYAEDARQKKGLTKQFREKTGIEKWLTPSTATTIRKADEKITSGEQHTRIGSVLTRHWQQEGRAAKDKTSEFRGKSHEDVAEVMASVVVELAVLRREGITVTEGRTKVALRGTIRAFLRKVGTMERRVGKLNEDFDSWSVAAGSEGRQHLLYREIEADARTLREDLRIVQLRSMGLDKMLASAGGRGAKASQPTIKLEL